jgi:hypothetical protein
MKSFYRLSLAHLIAFSIALMGCSKHHADLTPMLAVESMMPSSGSDSTLVTITGTEFSPTAAGDLVSFNGKQATVLSATSTSLVVRTPTLAGTGEVTVTVGGKTINAGSFYYDIKWKGIAITDTITTPEYLSTDAGGNLYVSSLLNSVVYKITPAGTISPFAAIPMPTGSAFDASGNLYVVSNGQNIVEVSPAGTVTPFATVNGLLLGLAMDPQGNLYAANEAGSSVDLISPQGVVSVYDSNISLCSGIAVNSGNVYVMASNVPGVTGPQVGTIYSWTLAKETAAIEFGLDYSGEAQLAFDNSNNLYAPTINVGDSLAVVFCRTAGGITSPLYGMPEIPYLVGIAPDAFGNVYVSGFQNTPTSHTGSVVKLIPH